MRERDRSLWTFQPRQVLAPVDFSNLSNLALKYAAAAAREYGARLTALDAEHVRTVLGAEHRPFLGSTFFGTTTERGLRHAPVPVLVAPHRTRGTGV